MYESIKEDKRVELSSVNTFADGTAVKLPGELTYQFCKEYVDEIYTMENLPDKCIYEADFIYATLPETKETIKAVIRAIRAIITATKALIVFLLAGGWIAALIVIVICMIGLLVSSIFGIFFSGEDMGNGSKSMTSVISELNQEFMGKITQIQNDNTLRKKERFSSPEERFHRF